MNQPLLSVCLITFNHEKYIDKCINSILSQKVDFDFEICIGEDSSTDRTLDICQHYANEYPDLIRLFPANCISKIYVNGILTGRQNFLNTLNSCKGEYIALMDGDDYWTKDYKLQKQVDFLIKNPNYAACVHLTKSVSETSEWKEEVFPEIPNGGCLTLKNAISLDSITASTSSFVFKKFYTNYNFPSWSERCFMGDRILLCRLTNIGPVFVLPQVMSHYRRHNSGLAYAYLKSKKKYAGSLSLLIFFRNIHHFIDCSKVEYIRVRMLRMFTIKYIKTVITSSSLNIFQKFFYIISAILHPAYIFTFKYGGVLDELKKIYTKTIYLLFRKYIKYQ